MDLLINLRQLNNNLYNSYVSKNRCLFHRNVYLKIKYQKKKKMKKILQTSKISLKIITDFFFYLQANSSSTANNYISGSDLVTYHRHQYTCGPYYFLMLVLVIYLKKKRFSRVFNKPLNRSTQKTSRLCFKKKKKTGDSVWFR